jgi:hypothetical protein
MHQAHARLMSKKVASIQVSNLGTRSESRRNLGQKSGARIFTAWILLDKSRRPSALSTGELAAIAHNMEASTPIIVEGDPDSWYGVQDPRERRKIQNRRAQRARRKRLASTDKSPNSFIRQARLTSTSPLDPPAHVLSKFKSVDRSPLDFATFLRIVPPVDVAREFMTPQVPPIVFSALFNNGAMMGISCGTVIPAKSKPQPAHIPLPLHPTAIQLITVHELWIDRLPFPKMRDNLITLQGIIENEDFLNDMFNMASFGIKPGGKGWDPRDWTIGKEFAEKWGYLFY